MFKIIKHICSIYNNIPQFEYLPQPYLSVFLMIHLANRDKQGMGDGKADGLYNYTAKQRGMVGTEDLLDSMIVDWVNKQD